MAAITTGRDERALVGDHGQLAGGHHLVRVALAVQHRVDHLPGQLVVQGARGG